MKTSIKSKEPERPLVSVVDDDESVRESLPDLLSEFGFAAQAFSSAQEFLRSNVVAQTRCLILDIAMPGMSGPELQRELARRGRAIPIVPPPTERRIFITVNILGSACAHLCSGL